LVFSKCQSLPFIASIALGIFLPSLLHSNASSLLSGEIVARCFKRAAHAALRRAAPGSLPNVAANILNCLFSPSYVPPASHSKNSRSSNASSLTLVSAAEFWVELTSRAKTFFRFDLPDHSQVIQTIHAIGLLRNCCIKVRCLRTISRLSVFFRFHAVLIRNTDWSPAFRQRL
jgi:hypothetical protein